MPPPMTTTGAVVISGPVVLNSARSGSRHSTARSSAARPARWCNQSKIGERGERDRGLEREPLDEPTGRAPVVERVADRVHPVHRADHRVELVDREPGLRRELPQRPGVEQVPVAREVVAAPVPPLRDREVERPGVVGDDQQPPARPQHPPDRPQHRGRVGDVLDRLDQDREVVAVGDEVELLDRAAVHEQPACLGGVGGATVEVHAFELPARLAELAEQVEVEAVAAPDVEDRRVGGQRAARREQAAGLEPAADAVDEAEVVFGERERVVVVRVDRAQLGAHRAAGRGRRARTCRTAP